MSNPEEKKGPGRPQGRSDGCSRMQKNGARNESASADDPCTRSQKQGVSCTTEKNTLSDPEDKKGRGRPQSRCDRCSHMHKKCERDEGASADDPCKRCDTSKVSCTTGKTTRGTYIECEHKRYKYMCKDCSSCEHAILRSKCAICKKPRGTSLLGAGTPSSTAAAAAAAATAASAGAGAPASGSEHEISDVKDSEAEVHIPEDESVDQESQPAVSAKAKTPAATRGTKRSKNDEHEDTHADLSTTPRQNKRSRVTATE